MTEYLRAALASVLAWANGLYVSWVRTFAPAAVGAVIVWATPVLEWLGVSPNEPGIVVTVSALAGGLWYAIARTFENQGKFAWLKVVGGLMLGIGTPPVYNVHPDNDALMKP